MKRCLLLLILFVLSSNYSHAISGYLESLAQDLSVSQSFIVEEKSVDDKGVINYRMSSPKFYDCEFAISMLGMQMRHYTNAEMVEAWTRINGDAFTTAYRVGTSYISLYLYSNGENEGITLLMHEIENCYKVKKAVHKSNKKPIRRR